MIRCAIDQALLRPRGVSFTIETGKALACRKLHPITENEQWTATNTPILHMCTIPSIACVLRLKMPVTSVALPMQLDLVSRRPYFADSLLHSSLSQSCSSLQACGGRICSRSLRQLDRVLKSSCTHLSPSSSPWHDDVFLG